MPRSLWFLLLSPPRLPSLTLPDAHAAASPFGCRRRFYEADAAMLEAAMAAPLPEGVTRRKGRLASGSIFVDAQTKRAMAEKVWSAVGSPDAVEMENAGVAQICMAYGVPYVSIRALSDLITGDANADFNAFCQQAADNAFPIVRHIAKAVP